MLAICQMAAVCMVDYVIVSADIQHNYYNKQILYTPTQNVFRSQFINLFTQDTTCNQPTMLIIRYVAMISCFEESPSFVTYRTRLEGTSETDSNSLISLIEEWVRGGGTSVIVTGILMTVDPHCSVAISSLSEPECSPAPPVIL